MTPSTSTASSTGGVLAPMTPAPRFSVSDDRVVCAMCGYKSHSLLSHVVESHSLSPGEYIAQYPGSATLSEAALVQLEATTHKAGGRKAAPFVGNLTVKLMGIELPVDAAVTEEKCLPLPDGYMFPTKGVAKAVFLRAVMALARGRNAFIWGMPGTGKDALVHAFSAYCRKPVVMVTFRPGTDLAPWFYTRSITESGTGWEYGHLWNALTQGIMGRDGKARPAIILLSDVDRADSAQAEWFRILTDSISGRILSPSGEMIPLMKGTQFVCTANSAGSGDSRGRMASSNPMDASILDRLGRKIEAAYMDWDDESKVLKGKFPLVAESAPEIFTAPDGKAGQLGLATAALRSAIEKQEIFAEFTHRGLEEVLKECEDILYFRGGKVPDNLLKQGFRAWLDGLEGDSQLAAKRLIDPFLKGGCLGAAEADEVTV